MLCSVRSQVQPCQNSGKFAASSVASLPPLQLYIHWLHRWLVLGILPMLPRCRCLRSLPACLPPRPLSICLHSATLKFSLVPFSMSTVCRVGPPGLQGHNRGRIKCASTLCQLRHYRHRVPPDLEVSLLMSWKILYFTFTQMRQSTCKLNWLTKSAKQLLSSIKYSPGRMNARRKSFTRSIN